MSGAGGPFGGDLDPDGLQIELEHPTRTLDLALLAEVIERAVQGEGFTVSYLGVVLTHGEAVHELNRTYLDHDYPTDVVSFPLDEDAVAAGVVDGEVYVDLDTAAERAAEFDATFEEEAMRYALHGLLHLMGYDDASEEDRQAMRQREDLYLRSV